MKIISDVLFGVGIGFVSYFFGAITGTLFFPLIIVFVFYSTTLITQAKKKRLERSEVLEYVWQTVGSVITVIALWSLTY